jgi:hypothetical protein
MLFSFWSCYHIFDWVSERSEETSSHTPSEDRKAGFPGEARGYLRVSEYLGREVLRHPEERAKLAEKSKIIFPYGTDFLRSKQIINADRFLKNCRRLLFDKLEFVAPLN